jgi:group II intron reverse transcriptase/maturase
MQNAETVIAVLQERGRRGLPLEELYRQLFNPSIYLMAYGRIYSNHGAMTPGVCGQTADGMSPAVITATIKALRSEEYRFSPVRRVWIPKKDPTKLRPLGIPGWVDKLVAEVVRLLLEAYYEPTFSGRSHGFRPGRGCHTALSEVAHEWTGTVWFIEADIRDCFGSLDHHVLISILAEKIKDQRFLRLIKQMLRAGYLEDFDWHPTLSGAPQGSGLSPLLSNVYLNKLDQFVENELIPRHTRGEHRHGNPAYRRLASRIDRARKRGDLGEVQALREQRQTMASGDPFDPGYRRLRYIRYADDHLLGFAGPKAEAQQIKEELAQFLSRELKLELSDDKTLITHARTQAARFLGYEVTVTRPHAKPTGRSRSMNGNIRLRVPRQVITDHIRRYTKAGKPARLTELTSRDPYEIVAYYGSRYRGVVQYYLLADNVHRFHRLRWVMETSMLKTLASKQRTTTNQAAARYRTKVLTAHGLRRCFEARRERDGRPPLTARVGGIPLSKRKNAVLDDAPAALGRTRQGTELVRRLTRQRCEVCGTRCRQPQVHQVRGLAVLDVDGPQWERIMTRMRRKTLIVCVPCHDRIHSKAGPE